MMLAGEHRSMGMGRMVLTENTGVLSTGGKTLTEEHRSMGKWWNGAGRGTQKY
jgi:hypothetical protein